MLREYVGPIETVEDVVGSQDRDGRVVLQFVETGYTLKVIERERRTFVWTSALCTLPGFNFAVSYNLKLMGSTVGASLATLFLSWSRVLRRTVLWFYVLGGSFGFCLQLF